MSAQSEVDAIFKDLDALPTTTAAPTSRTTAPKGPDSSAAAAALAELDDLANTTPSKSRLTAVGGAGAGAGIARPSSRATERVSLSSLKAKSAAASAEASRSATPGPAAQASAGLPASESAGSSGGWGWGSVWSTASTAIAQAKTVVDEGVKNLPKVQVPQAEQTRQWREGLVDYVKNAQLDKLSHDLRAVSLSTFNDILNVVAPPIADHEVIQVWLSHDLEGYDGVETLVYRALARILEQVEGGDLIVNKGNEARPKDHSGSGRRELNAVEGFDSALKLAIANIDDLDKPGVKSSSDQKPESTPDSLTNPTTYTTVYLRIQPYTSPSPFPSSSTNSPSTSATMNTPDNLQFLLHLRDPSHNLSLSTLTQPLPAKWMALWDAHEWVEDQLAEALRLGVEMLGQEYVVERMGWDKTEGSVGSSPKGKDREASATDTDGEFEKVEK